MAQRLGLAQRQRPKDPERHETIQNLGVLCPGLGAVGRGSDAVPLLLGLAGAEADHPVP